MHGGYLAKSPDSHWSFQEQGNLLWSDTEIYFSKLLRLRVICYYWLILGFAKHVKWHFRMRKKKKRRSRWNSWRYFLRARKLVYFPSDSVLPCAKAVSLLLDSAMHKPTTQPCRRKLTVPSTGSPFKKLKDRVEMVNAKTGKTQTAGPVCQPSSNPWGWRCGLRHVLPDLLLLSPSCSVSSPGPGLTPHPITLSLFMQSTGVQRICVLCFKSCNGSKIKALICSFSLSPPLPLFFSSLSRSLTFSLSHCVFPSLNIPLVVTVTIVWFFSFILFSCTTIAR